MEILDYNIWVDELPENIFEFRIYNTLNAHSYQTAKRDKQFRKALETSDVLLPDGIGIVWAARMIMKKKIKKIAGSDLHVHVLKILNGNQGSCFYLGSSNDTLQRIRDRIASEYPTIRTGFFAPPFKQSFSEEDSQAMITEVNRFKPDVLFVGMTAPKQEKWVHQNKEVLDCRIICSIGAVFDFYAGTSRRPSTFWINSGLEFLPRFIHEPRRLWRRNLISTPSFILEVLKQTVRSRIM